jgi:hypothetical protein
MYAFDLIELNGDDLRRDPLEARKATLKMMLAKAGQASDSTSISKATARPCSGMPASSASKVSCRSGRLALPLGALAGLAQDEEPGCTGREARS